MPLLMRGTPWSLLWREICPGQRVLPHPIGERGGSVGVTCLIGQRVIPHTDGGNGVVVSTEDGGIVGSSHSGFSYWVRTEGQVPRSVVRVQHGYQVTRTWSCLTTLVFMH